MVNVVITGAGGGIGARLCERYIENGDAVVAVDRSAEALERLYCDVAARLVADVSSQEQTSRAFAELTEEVGAPDVVVNLAGGEPVTAPASILDVSPALVDEVTDGNLKGTIYVSQAALGLMMPRGSGSLVLVASLAGRTASIFTDAVYHGAKAGVIGASRRLAQEAAGSGVRVNVIAPGTFYTPAMKGVFDQRSPEIQEKIRDSVAMKRGGELDEICDAIMFMGSPQASYITGSVLDVNGGRFMP